MKNTNFSTTTPHTNTLVKSGLKKIAQTPDFKICIPDYTQTPDIYLDNISGYARKDAYQVTTKIHSLTLDEFLGYVGANEPTTYYFIPISQRYFQNRKNEILLVDRFMNVQDKDYVIYSEDGRMRLSSVRLEAGIVVVQDSKNRYTPEQFQKEIVWGVVAGVVLV